MEETLVLVMLVLVMLVGSYLAGNIPLVMNLSEEKLRVATILGAGLLVGTALTVIIPEGIRALYDSGRECTNRGLPGGENDILIAAAVAAAGVMPADSADVSVGDIARIINGKRSPPPIVSEHQQQHKQLLNHEADPESNHRHQDYSSKIGLSLVLGFIFMMLIDQISIRKNESTTGADRYITATLGLVVHAAADGVALGAAATTSHQDVEMIVFLAIMLHKAPAAFGLVSFLLHEGIERQRIRKHLAIFSLSAPALTLLTYFGIGQEQKETLNSVNATGIAMLFSAGTFLYVATVHVLPELTSSSQNDSRHNHGHSGNPRKKLPSAVSSGGNDTIVYSHLEDGSTGGVGVIQPKGFSGLRNTELFIMICGALLPLVITFGHHH